MLGVLRTYGLTSFEIRRLDRRDATVVDNQLVIHVRGRNERTVTIDDPDVLALHRKWMQSRLFCAYPAYITSRVSGRLAIDKILRITNAARKEAAAQ